MPLALDDDHSALADSVAGLARRHAPIEMTRAAFDDLAAGRRPGIWTVLVDHGLHALHLSEAYGGAGAGLVELVVVAEQLGRALVPGPWLPTVLTSAVVASTADSDPALLTSFGQGTTGALVLDGLTARASGEGWVVSGTSAPTIGLTDADVVVVRADLDGEALWFRLDPGSADVRPADGVDLTRPVGRLHLDGYLVPREASLAAPDPDRVDLVLTALLAAEAAGVAGWAVNCAVEYAKTRVQFGRPIGSFQAVQHKAALMLVRSEIAVAAAWDAARAEDQSATQKRLAAGQAAVNALPAAVDVALDCVTLLGGIGFTWEHDAHLYWRRAVTLSAVAGAEDRWASRLGEAAMAGTRDFSFVDAGALPDLRRTVGAVLDDVATLPEGEVDDGWAPSRGGARRARLAGAGLVAPHYPEPYGLAAGPREQAVIAEEFARRGLSRPTTVIGEWVLPTLLVHGSDAQQDRFVGPTLRGEVVWCQLFSEPGAGSDLASLTTRATRTDGGWRISGQKVWNSVAHEADWGVCLARTETEAPKHKGISYFLIDMRSTGVDVRPLKQSTGRSEFNEVFLDDVFVPDECLVGEPNTGWKLAVTTLSNERLSMGEKLGHGSAHRVRELAHDGGHAGTRDDLLRVLGRNTAREIALSALNLRSVLARLSGLDVGAEISVQKVFNAIAQREGSRALISLLGPAGAVTDGGHVLDHIGLPAVLIGGGTIEIQLNVIAQRVLALPR